MDTILSQAVKLAASVDHNFKLGAVIHNASKVYGKGVNKYSARNRLKSRFHNGRDSIHAEVAALFDAGRRAKGRDLTVIRIDAEGRLRNSKPCKHCSVYIKHCGVRKVTYSDSKGELVTINSSEL